MQEASASLSTVCDTNGTRLETFQARNNFHLSEAAANSKLFSMEPRSWLWRSFSQHDCTALCSSTPAPVLPLTYVSSLRWRQLCSVFILTPCSVCGVQTLQGDPYSRASINVQRLKYTQDWMEAAPVSQGIVASYLCWVFIQEENAARIEWPSKTRPEEKQWRQ